MLTVRLRCGSTKNVKLRQKQFDITDIGKSSSRKLRRVIYYSLYRMDPQKTHWKNRVCAKITNTQNLERQIALRWGGGGAAALGLGDASPRPWGPTLRARARLSVTIPYWVAPVVGVRGREGKGGTDIKKTCSEYVKFICVWLLLLCLFEFQIFRISKTYSVYLLCQYSKRLQHMCVLHVSTIQHFKFCFLLFWCMCVCFDKINKYIYIYI